MPITSLSSKNNSGGSGGNSRNPGSDGPMHVYAPESVNNYRNVYNVRRDRPPQTPPGTLYDPFELPNPYTDGMKISIPIMTRREYELKKKREVSIPVSSPEDKEEKEADQVAEQVMTDLQPEKKKKKLAEETSPDQVMGKGTTGGTLDAGTAEGVRNLQGKGSPLSDRTRVDMERSFGADFSSVRIHTGSDAQTLSRNLNARAFTYGSDIAFNKNEYSPDSQSGKRLLAHELAHTVQQGAVGKQKHAARQELPEAESNQSSIDPILEYGNLKKKLKKWLESPISYKSLHEDWIRLSKLHSLLLYTGQLSVISNVFDSDTNLTLSIIKLLKGIIEPSILFDSLVRQAIHLARFRASWLFKNYNRYPINPLYKAMREKTGNTVDLSPNPYIGTSQDDIEIAYRAWISGSIKKDPWIILGLQKTEGFGGQLAKSVHEYGSENGIPAATARDAIIYYRTQLFYVESGMDFFTDHKYNAALKDNAIDIKSRKALRAQERAFQSRVQQLVDAGVLPHNTANEITAQIAAEQIKPNLYRAYIKNYMRYYKLIFQLSDSFFRLKEKELTNRSGVSDSKDLRLLYVYWNIRNFDKFVQSAEKHRKEIEHRKPGGTAPSLTEWAFESKVKENEYGKPRWNAVRFGYFSEAYRYAYEGW